MSAVISPCGLWRYRLDRETGGDGPVIAFLLHNPSTADADTDDPTSRRGIGYVRMWGGRRMVFINPWAGRATLPASLWKMEDPVGPENDRHISIVAREVSSSGGFVVVCWGKVSPPAVLRSSVETRLREVQQIMFNCDVDLRCLGRNLDGSPKHPLYLRSDAMPVGFP